MNHPTTLQDLHAEGELLVRPDVLHAPGGRGGTQGPQRQDSRSGLLALRGANVSDVHR